MSCLLASSRLFFFCFQLELEPLFSVSALLLLLLRACVCGLAGGFGFGQSHGLDRMCVACLSSRAVVVPSSIQSSVMSSCYDLPCHGHTRRF
ncbi:hypothetical protein BC567DRAFT_237884 [Phyllosticta citribraziliensis]